MMVSSCQTSKMVREPIAIPVVLQPAFRSCFPSESEAKLEIEKNGARVFTSSVVWSMVNLDDMNLQVNNPIGETIFDVKRSGGQWIILPPDQIRIAEGRDGLLKIEGHDIPLKNFELGCLLSGVWPASWMRWLSVTVDDGRRFQMSGRDGGRSIKIDMPYAGASTGRGLGAVLSCAEFRWGGFFGFFQRVVSLCRESSKSGLNVKLTGINDYNVTWNIDHGG
jgi:hypothetical protein